MHKRSKLPQLSTSLQHVSVLGPPPVRPRSRAARAGSPHHPGDGRARSRHQRHVSRRQVRSKTEAREPAAQGLPGTDTALAVRKPATSELVFNNKLFTVQHEVENQLLVCTSN